MKMNLHFKHLRISIMPDENFCFNLGHCATGDCGGRIECNGAGGVPPATLAEFQFDGHGGLDYYDVSLVDGYNLPMAIQSNKRELNKE